jgi:hypothetical protein
MKSAGNEGEKILTQEADYGKKVGDYINKGPALGRRLAMVGSPSVLWMTAFAFYTH